MLHPFLKSILQHHYNVGLIWIIMRFEQEEMSNCLRNEINRYFDKQNFSDGMVFDFFKLLIEFNETIWYLDCFDDNEVNDIYNSLNILISSKLSLREKNELLKLVVQYGMSPYYLCYFFEKEQVDEKLLLAYKSLVSSINCLVVGNDESLKTKSGKIEESFKKIKEICGNNLITNACYHSIIEKYDSDAKETAEILLNRYSEYYYRRYIKILRAMLGFIAQNTIRKKSVIYIKNWLEKEDAQRDRLESYNLAEYELHKVLNDLENGDYNHKFENIHQVHNFLHQWALFEAPTVDIRELPNKLHDLVEFCNTFSMEKSKILRFESNLVEIELPMCTHKASFVINQTGFSVEFSESPETEDERIGRLVALDYIVERFFDEHYKIDHFYEKQLGSWKWLVYGKTIEEEEYLNYLSSDKMYVMLACGQYCYYVTRNTKHKIREYYGLDNKELKNLLHTSDDSVEFYLQYLLCKELHDLDLDKKGYANLFITDANCMYMRNYEKKALIKQNIYQLDKFNDDYNFYGFVSQIEEKGNKKASIINYIISEEDLIKNHSFKIINFFHDLLDKQKLLMYNQIGVRGVLLNCENTDIKDAEIIFEMIEECQLDWVVIGGGEHISIGQRRYEKFVNKINNKSNWTPISL